MSGIALNKVASYGRDLRGSPNYCFSRGCRLPESINAAPSSKVCFCEAIGAAYRPDTNPSPADMAPEFSRSAHGAETWVALLSLGQDGVANLVLRFHRYAKKLQDAGFVVPHDVHFNQVFVTLPVDEELCAEITRTVQDSGEAWFGEARWQGRAGFRLSISNWAITDRDIDRLVAALTKAKSTVLDA